MMFLFVLTLVIAIFLAVALCVAALESSVGIFIGSTRLSSITQHGRCLLSSHSWLTMKIAQEYQAKFLTTSVMLMYATNGECGTSIRTGVLPNSSCGT